MRPLVVVLSILMAVSLAAQARAEKRVALVIGNSAYKSAVELKNPRNDATDLASALGRLGFEVVAGNDLDKRTMERTIRDFGQKLAGADVALFFFAGHGLQVGGQNYLVPIDAQLAGEGDVDFEGIPLNLVLKQMEREAKTSIVLLDACRDNPLARNLARSMGTRGGQIGQGLAEVKAGVGTLIGFSTQPGNVALDGEGRNSPYAGALVKHVATAGKDVSAILVAVRNDVLQATGGRQVPWEHTSLTGQVFLQSASSPEAAPPAAAPPTTPATADYDKEMEIAFWNAVKDSKSPAVLQTYLDRFPTGTFAGLARVLIDQLAKEKTKAAEGSKVATLPAPSQPPRQPEPATNPLALARALQAELRRVGCEPGSVSGNWDAYSVTAMRHFVRLTGIVVPTDQPTEPALNAVVSRKDSVCTIVCGPGELKIGAQCVERTSDGPSRAVEGRRPRPRIIRVCERRNGVLVCRRVRAR
jgi:caspase domain-containing protein